VIVSVPTVIQGLQPVSQPAVSLPMQSAPAAVQPALQPLSVAQPLTVAQPQSVVLAAEPTVDVSQVPMPASSSEPAFNKVPRLFAALYQLQLYCLGAY